MGNKVIDAYDIIDKIEEESNDSERLSASDALIRCINKKGRVSIPYLRRMTGLDTLTLIKELSGAIYQCPEPFLDASVPYDLEKHWVLSSQYLCGNIKEKLKNATILEERYPGSFFENIDALSAILPAEVNIEDIHINLGLTCIPPEEIGKFISYLFGVSETEVYCDSITSKYKVVMNEQLRTSRLNNEVYAVLSDNPIVRIKPYLTGVEIIEDTQNASRRLTTSMSGIP